MNVARMRCPGIAWPEFLIREEMLMSARRTLSIIAAIFCLLLLQGCAHFSQSDNGDLDITIAHVNDTHSHLEAAEFSLKIEGNPTQTALGGMARLKSALDDLRAKDKNVLFLHGGDMVQGTLYFAKYQGMADMDILNMLDLDVATAGNHEFDEGPGLLASLISMARFPIVSSNIDVSKEPRLAGSLAPYAIKTIGGERVAVIGITTTDTPAISNPGPTVSFNDPAGSVMASVAELHKIGVRKIILLSHLGYEDDIALAKKIAGIQVIVGGNSHTLLGDRAAFRTFGLNPKGAYPTVVKNRDGKDVLIVQAWEWAKVIGVLRVRFNSGGEIAAWSGAPMLLAGTTFKQNDAVIVEGSQAYAYIISSLRSSGVVGIYEEDERVKAKLAEYAGPMKDMMNTVIARADKELIRGNNRGPGPIVADSMLIKTRAAGVQIAIQNTGGVRRDVSAGDISVAEVYELLPFNNTLVIIDLTGAQLVSALEEAVDFQIAGGNKGPHLYVAGISFRIDKSAKKGMRIREAKVKSADGSYGALEGANTYRIVTSSYLAGGGDGMHIFRQAAGYRSDTGFIDAEVLMEYLKGLGTVTAPTEKRISSMPSHITRVVVISPYAAYPNKLLCEFRKAA
jgi:5'-nucleotidase